MRKWIKVLDKKVLISLGTGLIFIVCLSLVTQNTINNKKNPTEFFLKTYNLSIHSIGKITICTEGDCNDSDSEPRSVQMRRRYIDHEYTVLGKKIAGFKMPDGSFFDVTRHPTKEFRFKNDTNNYCKAYFISSDEVSIDPPTIGPSADKYYAALVIQDDSNR